MAVWTVVALQARRVPRHSKSYLSVTWRNSRGGRARHWRAAPASVRQYDARIIPACCAAATQQARPCAAGGSGSWTFDFGALLPQRGCRGERDISNGAGANAGRLPPRRGGAANQPVNSTVYFANTNMAYVKIAVPLSSALWPQRSTIASISFS